MNEKFVTLATYDKSFEAQLAKNLLEGEGINATLSGELTADLLPFGQAGGGDQIALQVRENDAQRASGILAAVAAAKLDDNWEEEAESGAGVWLCSICGEPISNRLSICHSCQTPREGIRADRPRDPTDIQQEPVALLTVVEGQKHDDIVPTIAPASTPAPEVEKAGGAEVLSSSSGDDLARRALIASMSGILLPFAWYYLVKLFFFPGELSPKGLRFLYGALFLTGWYILFGIIFCGGIVAWL